jgi:hypothetical protein
LVFVGRIKEVFLFLPTAKSKLSEGRGLISLLVRVGMHPFGVPLLRQKEKLKFGDGMEQQSTRDYFGLEELRYIFQK